MKNSNPIGVFDSGIGGLSVLKHLVHLLPSERYIYLGDTARVPYGNKSVETVQLYSRQCSAFLQSHDVKLIIVACNTASSVALEVVQAASSVPVIGVIKPSADAALAASHNGVIGVIGTRATVGSNAYTHAIQEIATNRSVRVVGQACPLFVPLAEEGWTSHPATRAIAGEYMKPLIEAGVDTVVLGCTHYPLLIDTIHDAIPGASLIDPGRHAAAEAMRLLDERKELAPLSEIPLTHINYYVTDIPSTFAQVAKQFLGFDVPQPRLTQLE